MYIYIYVYMYIYIYIYIIRLYNTYIYIYIYIYMRGRPGQFGGGDDTVGNPHRAQVSPLELFELKLVDSSFSSLSS